MALLNLANGVDTVVPYKTVAAALDVPEDDVEQWVVDAIEDELVEARFDQLTETIHFLYATHTSHLLTGMSNHMAIPDTLHIETLVWNSGSNSEPSLPLGEKLSRE